MPPAPAPSNIRAYVRWRDSNVYAGEEIECVITFRNIAAVPGEDKSEEQELGYSNGTPKGNKPLPNAPPTSQSRRSSIIQGKPILARTQSMKTGVPTQQSRGHRPTLSLNVVNGPSRGGLQSAPMPTKTPTSAVAKGHGRSLSIVSLGSDRTNESRVPSLGSTAKRPTKSHARSASLQLVPTPRTQNSPYVGGISPRQPSPLYESNTPPPLAEGQSEPLPIRPARKRPGTVSAGNTPHLGRQNSYHKRQPSEAFNQNFSFPAGPQPLRKSPSPKPERPRPPRSPSNMHSGQHRPISPRPPEGWSGALSNLNPLMRVMSETSTAGTPRSSGEFYSMSNVSDETLTSELPNQNEPNGRFPPKPAHSRQASRKNGSPGPAQPETLMMGYAQTMGYFTIDGSLVNPAPFEEVKRKGVQSGGGVVGVERSKRTSGMFGAFSWGTIGESLGGLLGADEKSSMAQMKATVGSKSIPLLSTPQHLLFVDLKLAPGESKSYNYRFALPRGLPPTHKGRAIKVTYHVALGIQRPEGQAVKHVQIPFRILGSYNSRGETLGHDLMSPYILLGDAARSSSIAPETPSSSGFPIFGPKVTLKKPTPPKQGLEDFLRYTERLLERPQHANDALVSPTSPITPNLSRKQSLADQPPSSVRDAVDFAIQRANHISNTAKQQQAEAQSANRFNIARSGHPVAVLTLLRPAYRLGEAVTGTIDFTAPSPDSTLPPQSPTFSVLAELESSERIDTSLALRSSSSINRVTRKVHSVTRENTLFARQISFSLIIPATATPTFETTGVSLLWRLRVEFTTQQQAPGLGLEAGVGSDHELFEEIGSDERGTTLIAKERLNGETFEIGVPLRIYGVPGIQGMSAECEPLEV